MMTVRLMRRGQLSDDERKSLQGCFPGETFTYRQASPKSGNDWLKFCRDTNADLVILPAEKPLPTSAMQAGFTHVAFTPQGPQRLVRLVPEFEPLQKPR